MKIDDPLALQKIKNNQFLSFVFIFNPGEPEGAYWEKFREKAGQTLVVLKRSQPTHIWEQETITIYRKSKYIIIKYVILVTSADTMSRERSVVLNHMIASVGGPMGVIPTIHHGQMIKRRT